MVLSNKKKKQKLREAKTELLLASEAQNNPSTKNAKAILLNQASTAKQLVQSLLETANQQPRLSNREKRREKATSLGGKSDALGEIDVKTGEDEVEVEVEESTKKKRKKRKREDGENEVDNAEVKEVKGEPISKKKKKKKKKKKNKKKKKVDNGDSEKLDTSKGVAGNGELLVAETVTSNIFESKENLEPSTKVYVGGIPFYSTEDDIRSYFEGCGTITEIDCMKFPESGKFRGIAIITFKTEAATTRALALDGSDMGGLYLKIQPYKSERANKASPFAPEIVEGYNRIYVGNLAWEITEDDLRNLFSTCNITSIRFGEDKETGEFKCYGHVDFADSESVKTALKLDQNIVCGRPIRISCALAKKGAVTGSTPLQEKTIYTQLKIEDSKPIQENIITNQPNSNDTYEAVAVPVSSKIRRRTCYECGEKGHLSSDCPIKKPIDQGAVTGSTPLQEKTIYTQLKIEDSKPIQENTITNQPNSNDTNEAVAVPVSSKIRRRTCYECGEKGHLSSDCPIKKPIDQGNPVTVCTPLKTEDIKPLLENTTTNQSNGNGTNEVAPVPLSSKIKRRTCYECGEKGHLSSACPKKQATAQ